MCHASLCDACRRGDVGRALALLEAGADVNQLDGVGKSPAYYAVECGDLACVKVCFAAGGKIILQGLHSGLSGSDAELYTYSVDLEAQARAWGTIR